MASSEPFAIDLEYQSRQEEEYNKNNESISYFIDEFGVFPPSNEKADIRFNKFLNMIMRYGTPVQIKTFIDLLNNYGYNPAAELIALTQLIDKYMEGEISESELDSESKTTTIFNVNSKKDSFETLTARGNLTITSASKSLGIDAIKPAIRRYTCHEQVAEFLSKYPKFLGAYYYIPWEFTGFFEHSVLIDPDTGTVYDPANNIAMSLKDWETYYPNPAFTIKGTTFNELKNKTIKTLGASISLYDLEEVRKRKRK